MGKRSAPAPIPVSEAELPETTSSDMIPLMQNMLTVMQNMTESLSEQGELIPLPGSSLPSVSDAFGEGVSWEETLDTMKTEAEQTVEENIKKRRGYSDTILTSPLTETEEPAVLTSVLTGA